MFAFGAIVLTRFPFTDLSGGKRRPALVVSRLAAHSAMVFAVFGFTSPTATKILR